VTTARSRENSYLPLLYLLRRWRDAKRQGVALVYRQEPTCAPRECISSWMRQQQQNV